MNISTFPDRVGRRRVQDGDRLPEDFDQLVRILAKGRNRQFFAGKNEQKQTDSSSLYFKENASTRGREIVVVR